ncbi:hypothetical protein HGRIS_001345 [Hohenbuehelia grisea]|uniref:Uncharacterized protein n=1 Tax=Hohenbuehelia grisea TaxID=104357 RepID=A0ABR3JP07_9AGAR
MTSSCDRFQGGLDTEDIPIANISLVVPGIPSLVCLGSKFQVIARVKGERSMSHSSRRSASTINNGACFSLRLLRIKNSGSFESVDTPTVMDLKLGKTETTHIMTRLAFGITVPAGRADVFAEIDLSGSAGLSFEKKVDNASSKGKRADHVLCRKDAVARASENDHGNGLEKRDLTDVLEKAGMAGCVYAVLQRRSRL